MEALLIACVVLSEVFPNPPGPESGAGSAGDCREFVEVYNTCAYAVDLTGYVLMDNAEGDSVVPFTDSTILRWHRVALGHTVLGPRAFGLILDPEYASSACEAHPPLPIEEGVLVLGVRDTDLGNGLASTDTLRWMAPDGTEVERVVGLDVPEGRSLERWSFTASRWMVSDSLSPGGWNTVSREVDPVVARFRLEGESLRVDVVERGFQSGIMEVALRVRGDVVDLRNVSVVPLETVQVVLAAGDVRPWAVGTLSVRMLEAARSYPVYFPSSAEGVRMTEIVAYGTVEWVELTNLSPDTVSLEGAVLTDAAGVTSGVFPPHRLPPGKSVVVTADGERFRSRWGDTIAVLVPEGQRMPVLNNRQEVLVLRFPGEVVMDSVVYAEAAAYDASLVRTTPATPVGPGGWRETPRPSPGWYSPPRLPEPGKLVLSARVFRPPREGLEIRFSLPEGDRVRRVRVYNDRGVRVRDLPGMAGVARGVVVWDGRNDAGEPLPAGLYLIVVEGERTTLRRVVGLWVR